MEYPFLSLVAFFGLYTVLFFTRRSLEQHPSHSFILRFVVGIVAWGLTAAAAIYGASLIVLATAFFTGDAGAGYEIVFQLIILIVVIRLYVYYEDNMELGEMKNFLRDALTFGNYVRKKDYELREELDRHETRRIYKEVTGVEPASDVTATAYDYYSPPLSKDHVPEQKVSLHLHDLNIRELAAGKQADVTEAFRLELMGNKAHPYIPLMNTMIIDGNTSTLSFDVILPVEQQLRWDGPNAKQRTIERMYEFLVIVTSLPWFSRYDRYTRTITATLVQTDLNDEAKEVWKEIMRFEISLAKMRSRGTMITPASVVEKIAKIIFYH
ncbi:MAG: hypothetical protein AB1728_08000 [Bacteroidota bacterium]